MESRSEERYVHLSLEELLVAQETKTKALKAMKEATKSLKEELEQLDKLINKALEQNEPQEPKKNEEKKTKGEKPCRVVHSLKKGRTSVLWHGDKWLHFPTEDFAHINTITEKAYMCAPVCLFACHGCQEIYRGANLALCKKGHLCCKSCVKSFSCTCEAELMFAYAGSKLELDELWGTGASASGMRYKLGQNPNTNSEGAPRVDKFKIKAGQLDYC
jgi:hypothetical protein